MSLISNYKQNGFRNYFRLHDPFISVCAGELFCPERVVETAKARWKKEGKIKMAPLKLRPASEAGKYDHPLRIRLKS